MARTLDVCGAYWISSNTEVCSTTAPLVTARFSPTPRAPAAGCHQPLPAERADQRVVAGGQAFDEVVDDEPHLLVVAPVQLGVGKQTFDRFGAGKVRLHNPVQHWILLPGRVAEPLVGPRRSAVGFTGRDRAELTGERVGATGDRARVLGEVRPEPGPGGVRHHPAGERPGGAGEQQVERCGQLVGGLGGGAHGVCHCYRVLSVAGTVMSRFWTFPVGPLGSASTSQTRRGYLYAATRSLT